VADSFDNILGGSDASLGLLRVLAENSFDSILITDTSRQGRIVYTNKAFKKLTGYDTSDVIGKTPRVLQGPGTDKKVIARLSDALASGRRFEGKAVNYKKDGTPFIMHWRVMPIKAGKEIKGWLAIQREGSVG
jgi:PAS domain S-box-containing protein